MAEFIAGTDVIGCNKGKESGMNRKMIITISIVVIICGIAAVIYGISQRNAVTIPLEGVELSSVAGTADMMDMREIVDTMDTIDTTKQATSNYVENQVVAVADSKREAKKIAKAIDGELLSYDEKVAIISIGITVEEMMERIEQDSSLPKVYPNYADYTAN